MTRHGLVEKTAADDTSPATDTRMSITITDADMHPPRTIPGRQYRAKEQRNGMTASILTHPGGGRAIADIGRSSKSP